MLAGGLWLPDEAQVRGPRLVQALAAASVKRGARFSEGRWATALVTTVAALDEVPEDLRLCARTLGASPRYTMLRVQIRAALPGILTGMRIAMAGAWTSIVAAELIAATSGLGYLIMQAGDYLNTALVFSGIIMIAIIALVLDVCLRGLLLLADPSRRR